MPTTGSQLQALGEAVRAARMQQSPLAALANFALPEESINSAAGVPSGREKRTTAKKRMTAKKRAARRR
jgi:hypothetical protein